MNPFVISIIMLVVSNMCFGAMKNLRSNAWGMAAIGTFVFAVYIAAHGIHAV